MSMKQILVGLDFSEESYLAAEEAANVAIHTGAVMTLAYIADEPDLMSTAGAPTESMLARYRERIERHFEEGRRHLRDVAERLSKRGAKVDHRLIEGHPDSALAETGKELSADLVVVGTHGRTGLRRLFLGSVAEKVVRICERNVMVVRAGGQSEGGYKRILVPTDFSSSAEEAVKLARTLVAPGGAIEIVHFWQVPSVLLPHSIPVDMHEPALAPMTRSLSEVATECGKELLARHDDGTVAMSFDTFEGRPVEAIRKRSDHYDLLVLGSHGRRGFRRALLGSVAEMTVRHATRSVAIARAAE